ncbi:hypothetical protein MOUN0_F04632 [Monosporozyma unispora]|nr:hypothetical protein C6P44_002791 [Kazachstania unispora]
MGIPIHKSDEEQSMQPSLPQTQWPFLRNLIGGQWEIQSSRASNGTFKLEETTETVISGNVFGDGQLAFVRDITYSDRDIFVAIYNQKFCEGIKFIIPSFPSRQIVFNQSFIDVKSIQLYDLNKIVVKLADTYVILKINQYGSYAFVMHWMHFGDVKSLKPDFYPIPKDYFVDTTELNAVLNYDGNGKAKLSVSLLDQSDNFKWDFEIKLPEERNNTSNNDLNSILLKDWVCLFDKSQLWFYPLKYLNLANLNDLLNNMNDLEGSQIEYNITFNLEELLEEDEYIEIINDMTHLRANMYMIKSNKKLFSIQLLLRESRYRNYKLISTNLTSQTQISTSFNGGNILILHQTSDGNSLTLFYWDGGRRRWVVSGSREVSTVRGKKLTLYGNDHHNNTQSDVTKLGHILVQDRVVPTGSNAEYKILHIVVQRH